MQIDSAVRAVLLCVKSHSGLLLALQRGAVCFGREDPFSPLRWGGGKMAATNQQTIADRLDIDDLLTRYATAVDTKDWDLYETCFTPDAFIDYTAAGGVKGRLPEVKKWLAEVMPLFPMTQHVVVNRVVTIDGDTATARSCFFNPMGVPDPDRGIKLFFDGGYYNDKLVRTSDGWRIAERVEETSYSTRMHPIADLMQ